MFLIRCLVILIIFVFLWLSLTVAIAIGVQVGLERFLDKLQKKGGKNG